MGVSIEHKPRDQLKVCIWMMMLKDCIHRVGNLSCEVCIIKIIWSAAD